MNKTKNARLCGMVMLAVILLMQLFDSYCADLFGKLQSYLYEEFLIGKSGLSVDGAASRMSIYMLPFYIIPILAPAARLLVDKIGKKKVFIGNALVLILGCFICLISRRLIVYLLGNGLVIFACSMDIQYMYIVEEIPENRRATLRGIAGGVAAAAGMLIPLLKSLLMHGAAEDWRRLYVAAIVMGALTFAVSFMLKKDMMVKKEKQNEVSRQETAAAKITSVKVCLLILFVLGSATVGITDYNEPMVRFAAVGERGVNTVLLIQPLVTLVITVLGGFAADWLGRKRMLTGYLLLSLTAVITYVTGCGTLSPGLLGVAWGVMVGAYFSAANLLSLMTMEQAKRGQLGKMSAVSTYANGGGNAIGMIICAFSVKYVGMGAIKLILTIPALIIAIILIAASMPKD